MNQSSAGKGDKPRNCFSKKFKDNYDFIKWNNRQKKENQKEKKDLDIFKNKQ